MVHIVRPKITTDMLSEVRLLGGFTADELNQLVLVGSLANVSAHNNIVIEGELTAGVYILLEGMVGIFKTNKLTGNTYDIGQLHAGSFFGEMSLADNSPRSATVKALTDCQLFYISKEAFDAFLNQSADLKLRFYENAIKLLAHRLRELDDNYVISQYQLWKIALTVDRDGTKRKAVA